MASKRKQILDAVIDACEGISGIGKVSDKLQALEELQPKDFPALFPIDSDATFERTSYLNASANDMSCAMDIIVSGYVFDQNNNVALKRTNLIQAVETALTSDTTLAALITDIVPSELVTDKGVRPNYGYFDFTFTVEYDYNHSNP